MKTAIVTLTRGYQNPQHYNSLIQRNISAHKYINAKKTHDVIIFHEGNIPPGHQDYIKERSGNLDMQFTDISPVWSGGYPGMCRFYSYDMWNYLRDYDYIMRIDEDCVVTRSDIDPFSYIGNNVFLKTASWEESHQPTNSTLPAFIEKITDIQPSRFYLHQFPYTNVCLSSVSFWLSDEINKVLKQIATDNMQITHRWGDLPVLGSLLNIYAPDRVGLFTNFEYTHASHNNTVIRCI